MLSWIPWKFISRVVSRRYQVLDPLTTIARIRNFAEPSEVHEPLEIVRAWIAFHARGIINTRAIQHNLDWIWPYWVEKQFDPTDQSFIPRAYSLSHINMTHRNWTAVGLPGWALYPLVDPRGLMTPHYDGWSLDFWIITNSREHLIPSQEEECVQHVNFQDTDSIITEFRKEKLTCSSQVTINNSNDVPEAQLNINASAVEGGKLVVSVRPYNVEGVHFIDSIEAGNDNHSWNINHKYDVHFSESPDYFYASNYEHGDVYHQIGHGSPTSSIRCKVGMATGAAVFNLDPNREKSIHLQVPLKQSMAKQDIEWNKHNGKRSSSWKQVKENVAQCRLPDRRYQSTFELAKRTLLLLSPHEVYPGPYVYRRFWYRDACFMLNALLAINDQKPAEYAFNEIFPARQKRDGFYESQEGEWDSNGEVMWLAGRMYKLFDYTFSNTAMQSLEKAADWMMKKRQKNKKGGPYEGLLPPGFSAEHFGPNNYYYWDNFWGVAGLRAVSEIFRDTGNTAFAEKCHQDASDFWRTILNSIESIPRARSRGAIPAAPNRRMDAGAIGSIVADYPTHLFEAGNERIKNTVDFLLDNCVIDNAFFQDMTHSGLNPYLTLQLSQILLRERDDRYRPLMEKTLAMASSTGQWPEAVHPHTGGGCMGDGQHGWAAAEWVLMVRALFIREETDELIIGSGLLPEWLESDEELFFGPSPTQHGTISVRVIKEDDKRKIKIVSHGKDASCPIRISIPGYQERNLEAFNQYESLVKEG